MLRKIKHTFITLGIASGITAGALFYTHNLDTCRVMVLAEVGKNQQFIDSVATPDFLTAMTRGR